MKKISALIITLLMLFTFLVPCYADIAPFNVPFAGQYGEYKDIDLVMKAGELRSLDQETAQFLHDEKNPIDVKAAIINSIGWHYDKRNLVEKYVQFIFKKSSKNIDLNALSGHDLFCIGYLTFLDGDNFTCRKAAPILEKARAKMPDSFTVAIITALVNSELANDGNYKTNGNKRWEPIQKVYDNKDLVLDMRYEARKKIFESLSFIRHDLLINPFIVAADPSSVTVEEGSEYLVHIDGGEAPYSVENEEEQAEISLVDNNLIVKGLKAGKCEVKVSDRNGSSVLLPIQVKPARSGTTPDSLKKIVLRIDDPYIAINNAPHLLDSDTSITPKTFDGTTIIPAKSFVEALGGKVSLIEESGKIIIEYQGKSFELQASSTKAYLDSIEEELPAAPQIINSEPFIPLRFISENFGYKVEWDGINKKITLSQGEEEEYEKPEPLDIQIDMSGFIFYYGKTLIHGDWIYYSNKDDNGNFYKIKTDGTGKTKLANSMPLYIKFQDNWLYFRDASYGFFYKLTPDGRAITRLVDDSPESIEVSGDWVYYSNRDDECKLYKVKTDGTGRVKLSDDKGTSDLRVYGEWIFYYIEDWDYEKHVYGSRHGYYKIKTDGSEIQKIE